MVPRKYFRYFDWKTILYQPILLDTQKQPREEACNFNKKETLAQVFCFEFCEFSKNIFSCRAPLDDCFWTPSFFTTFSKQGRKKRKKQRERISFGDILDFYISSRMISLPINLQLGCENFVSSRKSNVWAFFQKIDNYFLWNQIGNKTATQLESYKSIYCGLKSMFPLRMLRGRNIAPLVT